MYDPQISNQIDAAVYNYYYSLIDDDHSLMLSIK